MGKTHFPPPEFSPRSNKQPKRLVPGNQRIEPKPHTHSNSRPPTPSNQKNKPTSRPPTDHYHGNSNFRTQMPPCEAPPHRRALRDSYRGQQNSNRTNSIGGGGQDHPVKYDRRGRSPSTERTAPSEVRIRLPEKFYSKGGESFVDVMKRPAPINPQYEYAKVLAQLEDQQHDDQDVGKPFAYTEFQGSAANGISIATTAQNQILDLNFNLNQGLSPFDGPNPLAVDREDDLPVVSESILNLNLDQDLIQFDEENPSVVDITDEPPIVEESTRKENIWGAGSFVEVLKKPAPIMPQIDASIAPQQFEGQQRPDVGGTGQYSMNSTANAPAMNCVSKNDRDRNGYRNQRRYNDRNDRSTTTRGRKTAVVKKPNRKEHHSRGEESVRDAAKKKIRTPELQIPSTFEQVEYQSVPAVNLPNFASTGTGFSSDFIIGHAYSDANVSGGNQNNSDPIDLSSVSTVEVNAAVANLSTFVDGILHRRSFVDVVRRWPAAEIQADRGNSSNFPDPSINQA